MKLIAHQGASLERPANTLESLTCGAQLGAYAVECDIHITADGRYVVFHDNTLDYYGDSRRVDQVTADEMRALVATKGRTLLTLTDIMEHYREDAYVLLHLKINPDEAFFRKVSEARVKFICGVQSLETAKLCSKYFPPERILAFLPAKNVYREFRDAGVGIVRLWETWLGEITPADVHAACPDLEAWIMCKRPGTPTSMHGSPESLARFLELGADGVLLNDIRMGAAFMSDK